MKLTTLITASLFAAAAHAQSLPNAVPMPTPEIQYLNSQGKPLSGAYLCSFAAGTTTPLATYTSSTAGTPNTNPIVLDSNGRASVWIGPQLYKFILYVGGTNACPSTGAVQWSQDNVSDLTLYFTNYVKTVGDVSLLTFSAGGTGAVSRNARSKMRDFVSVLDYGAVCDGSTDDTVAINHAISALNNGQTALLPAGTCKANITLDSTQSISGVGNGVANPGYVGAQGPSVLKDASGGTKAVITIASGANSAAVSNVTLSGSGVGITDRGILAANASNLQIFNVTCDNFGAECVRHVAGQAMRMQYVLAGNCLLNRSVSNWTEHMGAIYEGGDDAYVTNVETSASFNIEGHSKSSNCYSAAMMVAGDNGFYMSNVFEVSELGLYVSNGAGINRFVNTRMDLNYCSGAWVFLGGNQWTNTLFLNNGRDGNNTWEALKVTAANNIFTNTLIQQLNGITLTYGITDNNSGASDANANNYEGTIGIPGTQLFNFTTSPSGSLVPWFKYPVTISNGTTAPNVENYTSWQFAQGSPLTINTLAGPPGHLACFLGNANVTFGTGGNIAPPNGIAQPMQSGQIYCYLNTGTVWRWINTDNNPQFRLVTASVEVSTPKVTVGHVFGSDTSGGASPAIAGGAGAGTSPTVSILGTDVGGYFTVTTGTGPSTFATVATVTWHTSYLGSGAACSFSPHNNHAVGTAVFFAASGSGASVLTITSPALSAATTYEWAYSCTQANSF